MIQLEIFEKKEKKKEIEEMERIVMRFHNLRWPLCLRRSGRAYVECIADFWYIFL